jgi:transcriptional regulator with XRE-family HTH domain
MTLIELAQALGYVAHSHISAVERGKKQPTVELVLKVARLFDVSMDQLTKDELEIAEETSAGVIRNNAVADGTIE